MEPIVGNHATRHREHASIVVMDCVAERGLQKIIAADVMVLSAEETNTPVHFPVIQPVNALTRSMPHTLGSMTTDNWNQ